VTSFFGMVKRQTKLFDALNGYFFSICNVKKKMSSINYKVINTYITNKGGIYG